MSRKFKLLKRPGRRPLVPLAAQLSHLRASKAALRVAKDLVKERLLPRLERWLGERVDARVTEAQQVNTVMGQIKKALNAQIKDARLEKVARGIAGQVSDRQRAEMVRQVGIELPPRTDRGLGKVIEAFTAENVALIKSVPGDYLDEVQRAVLAGVNAGQRHETLAELIEDRFGVAEKRAALIARDQVSKFNGRLVQVRQENLGITAYIWRTVRDQRVRDGHADRDGETYLWRDPPGDPTDPADFGHPGQAINCRCFAEGVIPDLE